MSYSGHKYVPVFSSQRDMQKFMSITHGQTTGSMIVSDYLNISARLSRHGIGIAIISFKDDQPIGKLYDATGQSPLPPYSEGSTER